jgi:methylglutaconyl-CoA hydratase
MADKVQLHIDEHGSATVLLNRPEVHNAFDPEMVHVLTAALEDIGSRDEVRAVVLMGAGESFCAGADIAHMRESARCTRRQNEAQALASARMFHTLYTLPQPTIACVRGAVRGGGCGLVAACDIAIASRLATFRFSEVKLGIIPAMISPYVIAAMGERAARRYMLTGEEFDVAEAFRTGLVHDIVEEEALVPRASALLAQLYTSGPRAMAAVKALIPVSAHATIDRRLVAETARRIAAVRATPEGQEGLSAFLEKRKPAWTTGTVLPARTKTVKKKAAKKSARPAQGKSRR